MIKKIIAFSLNNRQFALIFAAALLIWGAYLAVNMPIDVLPDLNKPTVTIMTEAEAMVPEDVELLITTPLEQVLNGATGVTRVRSQSGLGLSAIKVEFDWNTDIYRNRQIVAEKLALVSSRLPEGVEPQMAPISSIMGQVQLIGLSSKDGKTSVQKLREIAEFQMQYDLMTVPGVSKVIIAGGTQKQLQVIIDPDKLVAYDVTVQDVAEAIEASNKNSSGGFIAMGSRAPVVTVTGRLEEYSELEDAVVSVDAARPVRIKDIGEVKFGPSSITIGESGVNGKSGVIMVIMKQPGYDTTKLSENIGIKIESIKASLGEDVVVSPQLFRQADFIERAVNNVIGAVRDGGIMVVLILFVFLMNWRTTVVTLATIPLSLAVIAVIFAAIDMSINTMTLGGLAVAVGALVDDAIVDVENSFRRLRQNALLPLAERRPVYIVIFEAFSEVIKPIMIGTALVLAGFIPLFFLDGLEGKLFIPIGLTYILGVVCSLLVSMTITPALCYYLLDPEKMGDVKEPLLVAKLKAWAGTLIMFSMDNAKKVLVTLSVTTALCIGLLLTSGTQFLPEFNEGVAQINLILPPDTSLEMSDSYGRSLEQMLMKIKGVSYVARRTGRAAGDEHAMGTNTSEAIVNFDPDAELSREEIISEIRDAIDVRFPGVAYAVDQPLAHMISSMLSGIKAQVAVKIYGPELQELRSIAKEVEKLLEPLPGVKDLMVEQQVLMPNVEIVPNRESLARYGLTVEDVADTIELAMGNEEVSRLIKGRYSYPVVMLFSEEGRSNIEKVQNFYLRGNEGELIKLKEVADVRQSLTTSSINHENVSRTIAVQHNVAGLSLGEVVASVEDTLAPLKKELAAKGNYYFKIGGQYEAQQSATRRMMIFSILTVVAMVATLYMHFKSFNLAFQVLCSIPAALIGAVLYIKFTGQTVSIATLVGLIALGGIAARNAILLLDHYIDLLKDEGYEFGKEMIIKAGQERMLPVLMTALTSGIGLIPLVLSSGEPGKEILYPIATVIIGGLISSTFLDFVFRPAAFYLFGQKAVAHSIYATEDSKADKVTVDIEEKIEHTFQENE